MKVLIIFAVLVALAYAANEAASAESDVGGDVTDQLADEQYRHGYGARPHSPQRHYSSSYGRRPSYGIGHNSGIRGRRSADETVDQDTAGYRNVGYGGYYGAHLQPNYGGNSYYGANDGGYYGWPYYG